MAPLNIFVTSIRPDPYINVIAYCLDHRNVDEIRLIAVSDHDYPEERSESLALDVLSNIQKQIQALRAGMYIDFGANETRSEVDLGSEAWSDYYSRLWDRMQRQCRISTDVVAHSDLDALLQKISQDGDALYDVTALRKSLLVDITSIMISINAKGLGAFELIKKPSYDDRDLYHCLEIGTDYQYRDLSGTKPVQGAMHRVSAATRRVRRTLATLAGVLFLLGVFALILDWESAVSVASLAGGVASIVGWAASFTK